MFKNAIVRTPSSTMINGLTTSADLGKPNYELALIQHQNYIKALSTCGLEVTVLPDLEQFPDACFVEDVSLLTEQFAVLTCPGAESRRDEVQEIEPSIQAFFKDRIFRINPPGRLEAGDVLRIDNHFFIGLSERTNKEGAEQLIYLLNQHGYTASVIQLKKFLHLKTGVSYLNNDYVLVSGELINHQAFGHLKQIVVSPEEAYAANCIMINEIVLLPKGCPKITHHLSELGFSIIELDMSEFRKLDGGLSCLSLRF
ncbi:TPA: N(G),N(G)-dimethylarginine dimethylaminohydrolase [Legionella pneumophila]|uniref:dimethylarginine dimethylaminohydrolase family protein n=1 Tax=Legionella pneumophila TaxID=446 RepID=UPI000770709D|nr:arginine deiminase family protein [Legionella pneumophila]HAT8969820.1 N(G),N(G)-dimethylarginine dimethylaminohydrolase [Legionella pneumophila subsp. pneumophila]CZH47851.1 N(G)%2CN(G)-dimethylarginine dimethylaminohydrolase [Legionella pneumophila]CZK01417.1 N(G)%2CN(G)-dimethylarginine dimethylaminohydrolase [Legionella pneumophila]CZK01960.1 N(G)%2CN(G)-dimethylarginine dimethylaminohydrolase [Legionella pneumophila]CZK07361.1 N(G)%2CN(G)-dimethylarginine dimethylaminohydrolase [Legion